MTIVSTARLWRHVQELCVAFNIGVSMLDSRSPDQAAAGYARDDAHLPLAQRRKVIRIAQVTDETTYAAALHELGHILHPCGMVTHEEGSREMRASGVPACVRDVRLQWVEEKAAWEWAKHNALDWTPVMEHIKRMSLKSYRRPGILGRNRRDDD